MFALTGTECYTVVCGCMTRLLLQHIDARLLVEPSDWIERQNGLNTGRWIYSGRTAAGVWSDICNCLLTTSPTQRQWQRSQAAARFAVTADRRLIAFLTDQDGRSCRVLHKSKKQAGKGLFVPCWIEVWHALPSCRIILRTAVGLCLSHVSAK